jgi:hypothetical protein
MTDPAPVTPDVTGAAEINSPADLADDPSRVAPARHGQPRDDAGASPVLPVGADFDREALREIAGAVIADFTRRPGPALRDRIADALWPLLEHAQAAAAGSHEGIRLWMLDCGQLVQKYRERAGAAEAKLAALAVAIPPERFRAMADWFDTDDEFKMSMFPETWPLGSRTAETQDDLRRFADLLDAERSDEGEPHHG